MKKSPYISLVLSFLFILALSSVAEARVKKPENFHADYGEGKGIVLTWSNPLKQDESGKVQLERQHANGEFSLIASTPVTKEGYLDSIDKLVPGESYRYRARIIEQNGKESKWIDSDLVYLPKAPHERVQGFLVEQAADEPAVKIQWTRNEAISAPVVIQRKEKGGEFIEISRVGPKETVFFDRSVKDQMTYGYQLYYAEDRFGKASPPTEIAFATFVVARQPAVKNLECKGQRLEGKSEILISWSPILSESAMVAGNSKWSVEIERRLNKGDYLPLAKLPSAAGLFRDQDLVVGNEEVAKQAGYPVIGSVYQYRVRHAATKETYAGVWQELSPVVLGVTRFYPPKVEVFPLKDEAGFSFHWQDVNSNKDPKVRIERRSETQAGYQEIAVVAESEGAYTDKGVSPTELYYYRFTNLSTEGLGSSEPVELLRLRLEPPAYLPPEAVAATFREMPGSSASVTLSWQVPASLQDTVPAPILEIYRSINNRDFQLLSEVPAKRDSFDDNTITSEGGVSRKRGNETVQVNIYKYRLRLKEDMTHAPSPWEETEEILVLGPA